MNRRRKYGTGGQVNRMSDDLISRKSLIENLNKFAPEHYTALVNDLIMKEQTAFDKEEVLEELNSERNLMYREDGTLMGARTQISIDRTIEIVEKGGIE